MDINLNSTHTSDLAVLDGGAKRTDSDIQDLLDLVYREHVERVYRYCLFRTNSCSDAEDIVSETFIRFLRSDRRPSDPGQALPWLFKVAGNLCVNHNRRRALGRLAASKVEPREAAYDEPWRSREIWYVVKQLKPIEQQIIYLKVVEDLSFKQTAELVSKREGAVKMIFYRAVKRLRRVLGKEDA